MTQQDSQGVERASLPRRVLRRIGLIAGESRRFERFLVCIPAAMRLEGRTYDLVGVVLELSRGGVMFREASDYILDRNGVAADLKLPGLVIPGIIVATRPMGYGLSFRTELTAEMVDELAYDYPMDDQFKAQYTKG